MVAHTEQLTVPTTSRINLFANTQRALPGYLTERQLRQGKTPLWVYPERKTPEKPAPKKEK